MTSYAVVAMPLGTRPIAERFLPDPAMVREGADRVYFIFRAGPIAEEFRDLDGQLLMGIFSFRTLAEAHAWIDHDTADRYLFSGQRQS
jgi:hypothetical protein